MVLGVTRPAAAINLPDESITRFVVGDDDPSAVVANSILPGISSLPGVPST